MTARRSREPAGAAADAAGKARLSFRPPRW
jgi:hypothetical protein